MLPLAPCFCLSLWIDSGRNLYTLIQGIFLLAEQNTRSSIWGTVNIIHNLALCPTVNMGTSFFWIDRIYWLSEHWAIAIRRQTGRDLFLHSDGCAPLWRDRLEIHMSQKEIDDFVQAFFFSVINFFKGKTKEKWRDFNMESLNNVNLPSCHQPDWPLSFL